MGMPARIVIRYALVASILQRARPLGKGLLPKGVFGRSLQGKPMRNIHNCAPVHIRQRRSALFLCNKDEGVIAAALGNRILAHHKIKTGPIITAQDGKGMIAVFYPGDNRHIAVDRGPDTLIQRAPSALRGCQEGIIAIPAGIGIAVLSEPILRFLFGGRETEIQVCIMPLSILGIAVIFLAIATPCFSILQTLGKPHKAIIIMLAGGIIKLFLNIILIRQPVINISGAAISTLVSEVFICVLSVRSVCKMTDLKPKVSEIFVKPTYAAIMCSVTAILSHETLTKIAHLQINHRSVTLFSIGIGSTMYFFCLYLLCETPKNIVN